MPQPKILHERSSTKPTRTKPAEQRRDELMNAAQSLFLHHGVANTVIEQITTRARVAKGTFYLYFPSKENILDALGERFAEDLLEEIKVAVDEKSEKNWKGKLAAWSAACLTHYLDSIHLHDVIFYSFRPRTREGLVDNPIIDDLETLLQSGANARAWKLDDPRFTAVFLFSALHGLVDYTVAREKRPNRPRLLKRVEQLFFRAVSPRA
jgi:AcrR family transcriptional regulator